MTGTKVITESGAIKKSDLIKEGLKNATKLEAGVVKLRLSEYLEDVKSDYIFLNSREINYTMVFDIRESDVLSVTEHLVDYLQNSQFMNHSDMGEAGLVDVNSLSFSDLDDIREISFEENGDLGLFIGDNLTYFKLIPCSWIVEKVKD